MKSNAGFSGPISAVALFFAAIVVFLQLDYMFDRIFGAPSPPKPTIWRYIRTVLYDRLSALQCCNSAPAPVGPVCRQCVYHGTKEVLLDKLPLLSRILDWSQSAERSSSTACSLG